MDWTAKQDEELSFQKGDVLQVHKLNEVLMRSNEDKNHTWYNGQLNGKSGMFPSKYWLYRPNGKPVSFESFSQTC
eukprot:749977-Hanusia_phi.AAC.8